MSRNEKLFQPARRSEPCSVLIGEASAKIIAELAKRLSKNQPHTELRARQNQLMREAGCAPIDWSKPHAAEFARIEPFREAARKELGYVD